MRATAGCVAGAARKMKTRPEGGPAFLGKAKQRRKNPAYPHRLSPAGKTTVEKSSFARGAASKKKSRKSYRCSKSNLSAKSAVIFPESITNGMPPPGCVAPPAKYKPPMSRALFGGRRKALVMLFDDVP